VTTTLIVPARNDSPFVAAVSRSCYPDLLACGVRLFEYSLGLLHTKSITLDGRVALAGSANMDRRSLELNFENNLLVLNPASPRPSASDSLATFPSRPPSKPKPSRAGPSTPG
jgi:cardiolipin synthase